MRVEITRQVPVKETVEITYPVYYVSQYDGDGYDVTKYGRITETGHVTVEETRNYASGWSYKFERENGKPNWASLSCYLDAGCKSTRAEFDEAYQRAIDAAQSWKAGEQ